MNKHKIENCSTCQFKADSFLGVSKTSPCSGCMNNDSYSPFKGTIDELKQLELRFYESIKEDHDKTTKKLETLLKIKRTN